MAILGLELVTGLTTRYAKVSRRAGLAGQCPSAKSAATVICQMTLQESCVLRE